MADESPGGRWAVVDIQQTSRVTPGDRFEDVYEATVQTAWGTVIKVQVPIAAYSPEVLRTAVEAEVQVLEQGRFLTG